MTLQSQIIPLVQIKMVSISTIDTFALLLHQEDISDSRVTSNPPTLESSQIKSDKNKELVEESGLDSMASLEVDPVSFSGHPEGKSTLDRLPAAPSDIPPILVSEKNPKMYQLVQMSNESSFWWDSAESDEGSAATGLFQNLSLFYQHMTDDVEYGNLIRNN